MSKTFSTSVEEIMYCVSFILWYSKLHGWIFEFKLNSAYQEYTPLGHEMLIFGNRWLDFQKNFVSLSWRILVFEFLLYYFSSFVIKVLVVEYSLLFQVFEFSESCFMAHSLIYSVKCSIHTWKGNLLCHLKLSIKSS